MTKRNLFIVPTAGLRAANDNRLASSNLRVLGPLERVGVTRSERHETLIFVEAGSVEFVIGGKIGIVAVGGCVRIPANMAYAYRNSTHEAATVLIRIAASGTATTTAA